MFLDRTAPKEPPRSGKPQAKLWCPRGRSCSRVDTGCLRCLLLVICTHPFAKEALTLHLARSEGHERYFGCNLMHRRVLASSHQHLIAEAPKPRRRHTAEQKAELLRQHVAEKKPVSEVCNEAAIQPSLFYTWQRELLAGAHTVFSTRRAPSRENELEAKISRLEARVARKDQIIAEVTEEYVTLKKKLGKA